MTLRLHIRDFPDELRPTTIVDLSNNPIVRSGFGKAVSAILFGARVAM